MPKKAKAPETDEAPEAKKAKLQPAAQPLAAPASALAAAALSHTTLSEGAVYSWAVEYAKSGRSKCSITGETIAEGALRIGKEIDSSFKVGAKMFVWHSAEPLFASFHKGNANKSKISSTAELIGFDALSKADQEKLSALVSAQQAIVAELAEAEKGAVRLEHAEKKWWSIVVAGSSTRTRWGKIGEDDNNVSEKAHADAAAAAKFMQKMIDEKTAKSGYFKV